MLSRRESLGATALLHLLPEEEVLSLAQTVTKGQIDVPSQKGLCLSMFVFLGRAVHPSPDPTTSP